MAGPLHQLGAGVAAGLAGVSAGRVALRQRADRTAGLPGHAAVGGATLIEGRKRRVHGTWHVRKPLLGSEHQVEDPWGLMRLSGKTRMIYQFCAATLGLVQRCEHHNHQRSDKTKLADHAAEG